MWPVIWSILILFVAAFAFGLVFPGGFCIFFCDDITAWIEAKTDEIRARTETIKQELRNDAD